MAKGSAARGREGVALLAAIITLGICMAVVFGLMRSVFSEFRSAHSDLQRVQALYCAEAGIEYAIDFIRRREDLPAAEIPLAEAGFADADGSFRVAAVPVISNGVPDPKGAVRVTATGFVPSETEVQAGRGALRRVVAIVSAGIWSFGTDAVRARGSVYYGANDNLTVVVDGDNNVVSPAPASVDASIRVTGTGPNSGSITSVASNDAAIAGGAIAPGQVDVLSGHARVVSGNNPNNYIESAFPDAATLGYDDSDPRELIWPPASGTWAEAFYHEALAGGTVTAPSGTIQGPKFVELNGTGTLTDVALRGPGTIFVHGDLGEGITNGPPPAQVVATGTLYTSGSGVYRSVPESSGTMAPPLILFGRDSTGWSAQIRGNSTWDLKGPLLSLHPDGEILISDSALGCYGALISNGTVHFKSNKGALGFPEFMSEARYTVPSLPVVRSYSAQ